MRILLVEDDSNLRKALAAFLKSTDSNSDIDAAANGDDALKFYLEHSYQIVITDHAHHGLLGIDLIGLILAKNPSQRIILQTGNYGAHIEAFKQKHSAIPVLEKPYPLQRLKDLVFDPL